MFPLADNGRIPGTLVAQTGEITLPTDTSEAAWYSGTLTGGNYTLQGGTTPTVYWIVLTGTTVGASNGSIQANQLACYSASSGSAPNLVYSANTGGSGDTPPSTWPASGETSWSGHANLVTYATVATATPTAALTGGTVPANAVLQRTTKTGGTNGLGYRTLNITGTWTVTAPTSATTASWGGTAAR